MTSIRKKPRMPPKVPKLPKKAVVRNPKPRQPAEVPVICMCVGGPMAGSLYPMYKSSPTTMVFALRGYSGHYRMGVSQVGGHVTADWVPA